MLASAVSPSPKEAQRLGKNGSDEIKNHEFFRGINFKKEALVIFAEDTSNFDPIDEGKLRPDRNSFYHSSMSLPSEDSSMMPVSLCSCLDPRDQWQ